MTTQRDVHRNEFNAMGSQVEVVLVGGSQREAAAVFARAAALAVEWERIFNRFRADSELSQLNRSGRILRPNPVLLDGVDAALAAARMTDGLFDPTILPSLVALGYDRPYAEIVAAGRDVTTGTDLADSTPTSGWREIVVDRSRREIALPLGIQIDLGGIAKGMYADRLADDLAGWPGGMVSAGGDMRLWGTPPGGDRWMIGVEHPDDPDRDIAAFDLLAGGVATSGTNRRYWRQDGRPLHHVIDPRTGLPADSSLRTVTVVAPSATEAEVAATALFIAGAMPDVVGWPTDRLMLAVGVDRECRLNVLYQRQEGHRDGSREDATRAA